MRHPLLFAQVSLALDPGVLYAPIATRRGLGPNPFERCST
jgi:hypothetical protein